MRKECGLLPPGFRMAALVMLSLFCTVSVAAASLRSSHAEQIAIILEDLYQEYCEARSLDSTRQAVSRNAAFQPQAGRRDSNVPDDAVTFVDKATLARFERHVTLLAYAGHCTVSVLPEADGVFPHLAKRVARREGLTRRHVTEGPVAGASKQYRYTSDAWQKDQAYGVLDLVEIENGRVSMAFSQIEHAENSDTVNDPDARWRVSSVRQLGFDVPVTEMVLGNHRLRLQVFDDDWSLVFLPIFYQYHETETPAYYYRTQAGLSIDDQAVPAYRGCMDGSNECKKDGAHFMMPLDEASLRMLREGRVLTIYAETTRNEEYTFEFDLTGLGDAMTETLRALPPELMAFTAFVQNDFYRILELLDDGLDPNIMIDGVPLLHRTLTAGKPRWARLLVRQGAFVDRRFKVDGEMVTGLMDAAVRGKDAEMLQHYLNFGADTEVRDSQGKTAFLRAVNYDDTPAKLEALKRGGANIFVADYHGHSRMHISATARSNRIVELEWLRENGFRFDPRDIHGYSPGLLAIQSVRLDAAAWLYSRGADPELANRKGQTAFDILQEIYDNPREYYLPARFNAEAADNLRESLGAVRDLLELARIVIRNHPEHGDITEGAIQATIEQSGEDRESVLRWLRSTM